MYLIPFNKLSKRGFGQKEVLVKKGFWSKRGFGQKEVLVKKISPK